jgi:hypothetical protein
MAMRRHPALTSVACAAEDEWKRRHALANPEAGGAGAKLANLAAELVPHDRVGRHPKAVLHGV